MKKLMTLIVVMTIYTITLAQKTMQVPGAILKAFEKQFPHSSNPNWEKEEGRYEVNFINEGRQSSALFSPSGSLEETEIVIPEATLPANALKIARAKGKINEATMIIKADGTIRYEAEVNKKDLLFDEKGNPVNK